MNAMAVPPPGWSRIGARELTSLAHRHFGRGLFLSALAHLVVLTAILAHHAGQRESRLRMTETPIDIVPTPRWPSVPIEPIAPESDATGGKVTDDGGIITPTAEPDFPLESLLRDIRTQPVSGVKGKGTPERSDTPTDTPAPPADPEPDAFVAHDEAPVPIYDPIPTYPPWARDAGISGRVLLHVLVGTDGLVKRVLVKRSVQGLDDAAREGIGRWRFRPALWKGHPVAVWVRIPVDFRLE